MKPTQNEKLSVVIRLIVESRVLKLRGPLRDLVDLAQNQAQYGGSSDGTISEDRWYTARAISDALDKLGEAIDREPACVVKSTTTSLVLNDPEWRDAAVATQQLQDALDFIEDNEFVLAVGTEPHRCLDCGAEAGQCHSQQCRWLDIMRRGGRR